MTQYPENANDLARFFPQENASLKECMKKPIPVQAVQINAPFRVDSLEGDYKQGKPGDYLMCGIKGELYICDKDIFEESYDWVDITKTSA